MRLRRTRHTADNIPRARLRILPETSDGTYDLVLTVPFLLDPARLVSHEHGSAKPSTYRSRPSKALTPRASCVSG